MAAKLLVVEATGQEAMDSQEPVVVVAVVLEVRGHQVQVVKAALAL